MNYAVGHNMPGYLPESDVEIFSTFEDAKDYLRGELISYADHVADVVGFDETLDDENVSGVLMAYDQVAGWTEPDTLYTSAHPGLAWWIMETDEEVTDDDR